MRRGALVALSLAGVVGLTGLVAGAGGARPQAHARAAAFPLIRMHFEFHIEERATHYTVVNTSDPGSVNLDKASYYWTLTPPANDTACDNHKHAGLHGTGKEFVWYHGNEGDPISDDGCNHDGNTLGPNGHQGTVSVTVEDGSWDCIASYTGTQRADGNASGDGPDGGCDAVGSPPPPPPPPPAAPPDCDRERAALAAAKEKVLTLKYALKSMEDAAAPAEKQLHDAVLQINEASTVTHVLGKVLTLGTLETDVDRAGNAFDKALAASKQAGELIAGVRKQLEKAEMDVIRAENALFICEHGGAASRLALAGPRVPGARVFCGQQKVALAKARARLSVYQSVSLSFGRVGLAGARAKLLEAQRLLADARSHLPANPKFQKLKQALDRAAPAVGRAASGIGRLIAAVRRIQAKVKPAQQQVDSAQKVLAACQK